MHYVLLGIGGSIGAILRYTVSIVFVTNQILLFPFATVIVNLLGCFFLGLLSSGLELKIKMNPTYLSAIKTGVIGSFTTFSTFSIEVMELLQYNYYLHAITYILISSIFGFIFTAFGLRIGRYIGERKKQL